jgi:spore coat-associated protein N
VKRFTTMIKSHRLLTLGALGLLVAAGSVAVYSGASFNFKTANPTNMFTAGILSHSNTKTGAAIVTATGMEPSQNKQGTVTIKNTGNVAGTFSVAKSAVADVAGANGGLLSTVLTISIIDVTVPATPVTKYTGALTAMTNVALGTFAALESHDYQVTLTFPDAGVPVSNTTGDNTFQGSSLTCQLDWTSVQ